MRLMLTAFLFVDALAYPLTGKTVAFWFWDTELRALENQFIWRRHDIFQNSKKSNVLDC